MIAEQQSSAFKLAWYWASRTIVDQYITSCSLKRSECGMSLNNNQAKWHINGGNVCRSDNSMAVTIAIVRKPPDDSEWPVKLQH